MRNDGPVASFPGGHEVAHSFNCCADVGQDEVRVDAVVPVHKHDTQFRGHEGAPRPNLHVVSAANVLNVGRDAGVSADACKTKRRRETVETRAP